MGEIARGTEGRTDVASFVDRTKTTVVDSAKHSGVVSISGSAATSKEYWATGSRKGSSGFIIASAGNTYITPTTGDNITASKLNTKDRYDIGVRYVSGSGHVYVLY